VLVTPGEQRHDDGTEIASPRGQDIFIARRPFAVAAALQKSRLDQSIEPSRQYVGSDPETPLELIEPRQPVECITQNENPTMPNRKRSPPAIRRRALELPPHRSRRMDAKRILRWRSKNWKPHAKI